MMKMKFTLLITLIVIGFGNKMFAQVPNNCYETLSLFVEPAKAKNYAGALPYYDKVINECPKFSLATYQYGTKMFSYFVKQGDKSKINDLIKSYEDRMSYFPTKTKKGKTLASIAQVKYDNSIGTKMQQYLAFYNAYKEDSETFTSPKSLYTYFSLAVDLYESGEKPIEDVFDLYEIVYLKIENEKITLATKATVLYDRQEAGEKLSSKETRKLKGYGTNLNAYGMVTGSLEGKLGKLADCENLVPLYSKDFEEKKGDINWVKKAASRLSAKECTEDPLFIKLVRQLDNLEPTSESKLYLSQLERNKGNVSKSIDYLEESAEMQSDNFKKSRIYFRIAELKRKQGSYGSARSYYKKSLKYNPSNGRCYLRIAQMYSKSSSNCGATVFEKRAVNWLAANMADKAAIVDASIKSEARAAANSYRLRAPSKSDIFSDGMAGKTVSFNCWIGGSVKVPSL
ncbi:MAG: tetratricopeptide (TPR) repeat protein [bacterium]|jgi:tetratricopeptide (TPR) repeat protein